MELGEILIFWFFVDFQPDQKVFELGRLSNDRDGNLLSNEGLESFWDALWLELWPFLFLTLVF